MRRRDFISALGGATAAWPLRAHLQTSSKPVAGFVHIGTADAYTNSRLAAFRRGLRDAGFIEGQNIAIEYRFAENKAERLPDLVADLVHRQVAVIFELGGGPMTALAAKRATSTIPIVIAFGSDPVRLGLVESLNRPGANVTGVTFFTTELVSKRLELLCEVLPQAKTIAYLRPGPRLSSIVTEQTTAEALTTANGLGRDLLVLEVERSQDLDATFSTLLEQHADALFIHPHPLFDSIEVNDRLAALTLQNAVPAISQQRSFPEAGGLMSYGANQGEAFRQAGLYTARILNGERPADLPFQQSTKVEFIINLKTAKVLGLDIPLPLLGRVDEVIE